MFPTHIRVLRKAIDKRDRGTSAMDFDEHETEEEQHWIRADHQPAGSKKITYAAEPMRKLKDHEIPALRASAESMGGRHVPRMVRDGFPPLHRFEFDKTQDAHRFVETHNGTNRPYSTFSAADLGGKSKKSANMPVAIKVRIPKAKAA